MKKITLYFIIFEIVIVSILMGLLHKMTIYNQELYISTEQRLQMLMAADRLRHSSDELTNFGRAYVITNNKEFKKQYLKVLEIRNGKTPRPIFYNAIYWDLNEDIRKQKHPDGKKLSLKTIFKTLPFSKKELSLLTLSEKNSNDLVNLEIKAFKAMANNNQSLAINLFYSDEYYKAKAKIMSPIDDFLIELDKRTKQNVDNIQLEINTNYIIFIIFTILFIFSNILIFRYLRNEEKKKLDEKNLLIEKLKNSEKKLSILNTLLEIKIEERTIDLEIAKEKMEIAYKHTNDSIKYASLIQGALIPLQNAMQPYFKDHFVIWKPKDIVGGDIWLFNDLRHKDECLIMFIDCTGHGVPGAFLTMIVKAVEREIISIINSHPNMEVSPAWVMTYFNRAIKQLLKQENKNSLSNAGFDGGIIYYNRQEQILKFTGAETPLFYVDEKNNFKVIKGNRYSVGYKKCNSDYEYKETIIKVQEGMKFYCTTDGYLDQNGGKKGFPFGKKRFKNIVENNNNKTMNEIKTIFIEEMIKYEKEIENNDRNDDITVIGFEIGSKTLD